MMSLSVSPLDDVPQPCSAGSWHDPIGSNPEGANSGVKTEPNETSVPDNSDWAINGTNEVMTLGLSGEYLGSVKAEPIPSSALQNLEGAREPASCSSEVFQGPCEDTSSLILQQLTILNHQLSEQLAEQRAFHCSMLGMMDRQIEVLEQLSAFTSSHQGAQTPRVTSPSNITTAANVTSVATTPITNAATIAAAVAAFDNSNSRVGQHTLVPQRQQDKEGHPPTPETLASAPLTPCLSNSSSAAAHQLSLLTLPPIVAPLALPVSPQAAETDSETSVQADEDEDDKEEEEEEVKLDGGTDADTDGLAKDSQLEGQPTCPKNAAQVNGLLDSHQD